VNVEVRRRRNRCADDVRQPGPRLGPGKLNSWESPCAGLGVAFRADDEVAAFAVGERSHRVPDMVGRDLAALGLPMQRLVILGLPEEPLNVFDLEVEPLGAEGVALADVGNELAALWRAGLRAKLVRWRGLLWEGFCHASK